MTAHAYACEEAHAVRAVSHAFLNDKLAANKVARAIRAPMMIEIAWSKPEIESKPKYVESI